VLFTNALNDNHGYVEKKSVHPSFFMIFFIMAKNSLFAKGAKKSAKQRLDQKTNFFSYSQPLGPKKYSPGWGSSDL